jgi:RimJ/RimL family protein N-acetyltransferase
VAAAELPPDPAPVPPRAPIRGRRVALVPLDPARHEQRLYASLHGRDADPRLWEYLPYGPFERGVWARWLAASARSEDPLFFAVERRDGEPLGFLSLMRIEPAHRCLEIGHVAFGPALQRTPEATEAIFLAARHALDELGYRRLEWKCDARNARSRAAAERFGFTYEGTFRQHMIVKGRNRDTAWYAILDYEWPPLRAAFERWLDDANFDADGRQRARLAELRG